MISMSTNYPKTVLPTKKQREILTFIEVFIADHGYSPSYREIMNGLDYTSVATVSLHVNSLIRRGHLRKRDRSARSLDVVGSQAASQGNTPALSNAQPAPERWLIDQTDGKLSNLEKAEEVMREAFDEIGVLLQALRILGHEAAASSFAPRLAELRVRIDDQADIPPKNSNGT